jgi:hypothetical protein
MKFELYIDKWERNFDKGDSYTVQPGDSTAKYLSLLDGKIHTQILVVPDDKRSSLLIGGGNGGTYVVTYTLGNDEDFYNLLNLNVTENQEVELVTGGQAGLFLNKYCVDFNTALEALSFYIDTGERTSRLDWEKQM